MFGEETNCCLFMRTLRISSLSWGRRSMSLIYDRGDKSQIGSRLCEATTSWGGNNREITPRMSVTKHFWHFFTLSFGQSQILCLFWRRWLERGTEALTDLWCFYEHRAHSVDFEVCRAGFLEFLLARNWLPSFLQLSKAIYKSVDL
jgi:hypothetical protein